MRYIFVFALVASMALPGDWPQFRGPNATGIGSGKNLPVEVGTGKNLLWKVAVPPGKSSPVLTADVLFLTAFEGKKLLTLCLDAKTGMPRWRRELIPDRTEYRSELNDPASPSPATDGSNAYAFFGDFGLVSYDSQGRERWRLPLGPFHSLHGMAASPVLHGNTLFLLCDHDGPSFLLAVDKDTGKIRWRVARPDVFSGFATPVVFRPRSGPDQLLILGSYQLVSYSAASGEKLWWVSGFSVQSKSVPVTAEGVVYCAMRGTEAEGPGNFPQFSSALAQHDRNKDGKLQLDETESFLYKSFAQVDRNGDGEIDEPEYERLRPLMNAETLVAAILPKGTGDLTNTAVLWRYRKGVPHVPSPLLYNGILYLVREGGIVTSLDAKSGEVGRQARISGAPGDYLASPIAAEDKIYTLSAEGKLGVLRPGLSWDVLAVSDLGEECYATPAISKSCIYVRSSKSVMCFGS